MSAHAHHHEHAGHETPALPDPSRAGRRDGLWAQAARATAHCLAGCAVGEVLGMVLGTWLGWSNGLTVAVSVALAFVFGYSFTIWPVMRAGLSLGAALGVALAADTVSIAVMEVVDNLVMLLIPGAMEAGPGTGLFWLALAGSLALAFVLTVPVNRALLVRGMGHAAAHRHRH